MQPSLRPKIIISYRRQDSSAYAGRIYDHLQGRYGKESVFMDVGTLQPGDNFLERLLTTINSCDVLVAVIGKHWAAAKDKDGRRLEHDDDIVRMEIATALKRRVTVIPTLVGGARMPSAKVLPDDLKGLAEFQACSLSDADFGHNMEALCKTIERAAAETGWPSRKGGGFNARPFLAYAAFCAYVGSATW
jgi:hypothetical protein